MQDWSATNRVRVAIAGATGYSGCEALRLLLPRSDVSIVALTSETIAGQPLSSSFSQFAPYDLPLLEPFAAIDWSQVDAAFMALPHRAASEKVVAALTSNPELRIIDFSADFRLDEDNYRTWYGDGHAMPSLMGEAVYGLTEFYREDIKSARLVANPGCYPTAALLATLPLVRDNLLENDSIVIDAMTGVSGAGRSLNRDFMHAELVDNCYAYKPGSHRHLGELDEQLSAMAGSQVRASFTPHLVPMSRGILETIHVSLQRGIDARALHSSLVQSYANEAFVHVLDYGELPSTAMVRASNMCLLGVAPDRAAGRAIVVSAIDNLMKGAAGQAVQNFNVVMGMPESRGLDMVALRP